jgi:5-methylcytosine-specific restriction endonuclease McrA
MDLSKFNKKSWLLGALRRLSSRYPPKYLTKVEARVERGKYKCSKCQKICRAKDVETDHIIPVIDPERGFTNWDDYINRLFCDKEGFQILCSECHLEKTLAENKNRVVTRRKKKAIDKS